MLLQTWEAEVGLNFDFDFDELLSPNCCCCYFFGDSLQLIFVADVVVVEMMKFSCYYWEMQNHYEFVEMVMVRLWHFGRMFQQDYRYYCHHYRYHHHHHVLGRVNHGRTSKANT